MFTKEQEQYLLRRISRNEVILFLGAGFSHGAVNRLGNNLPVGSQFSEVIWKHLGLPDPFDDRESLQSMYELLISKGTKKEKVIELLQNHFIASHIPSIYDNIVIPFWNKIYTVNIDNLIETVYARNNKKVDRLSYPLDDYEERDLSLERTQVIHLHGSVVSENPDEIIFSRKQYAAASFQLQPLYVQFTHDYASMTTIFVGTALQEQIFEQYIEIRGQRRTKMTEERPQSFLISQSIPTAQQVLLSSRYNIEPIEATSEDFLEWINTNRDKIPDKLETLKIVVPALYDLYNKKEPALVKAYGEDFAEFTKGFNGISPALKTQRKLEKQFYFGTSPTWQDIHNNLDAPRLITDEIFNYITEHATSSNELSTIAILGSAGSGKSTLLKRLGLSLIQKKGQIAFLSYSEYLPDYDSILTTINTFKQKVVLLFDNAELILNQYPNLANKLAGAINPPIVILSTRTNLFDRMTSKLSPAVKIKEFHMPDLNRGEIIELLKVLDRNDVLGYLKGLPQEQRIKEFEYRAKKQILVAMRETTEGKRFNDILKSEFEQIEPDKAKFLCLCMALTTEAGFTVSKQDLIGFTNYDPNETLYYLDRSLRGIIVAAGSKQDRFLIRHRTIAEYIVSNCASDMELKKVYLNVLSSLANEITKDDWKSRKFSLYREIINHQNIFARFRGQIETARELYDSLIQYFRDDFHFWLQYGCLELEGNGGDLQLAENYLNQAASLRPRNIYCRNAIANLHFKKGINASNLRQAIDSRNTANDIMNELLNTDRVEDAHTFHIYCVGNYNWLINWFSGDVATMKEELSKLRTVIRRGIDIHPVNQRLSQVYQTIHKAWLLTASVGHIEFPQI